VAPLEKGKKKPIVVNDIGLVSFLKNLNLKKNDHGVDFNMIIVV